MTSGTFWHISLGHWHCGGTGAQSVGVTLIITIINNNSPGQRPIGVLDPLQGCVWNVPRPRKVGTPGPSAAEVGAHRSGRIRINLPRNHDDLRFTKDPDDASTITP